MIRRKVTHVIKNQFDDIIGLSNPEDQWTKSLKEVYEEINSGSYHYYINHNERIVLLKGYKDHFGHINVYTDPVYSSVNYLDTLPSQMTVGIS